MQYYHKALSGATSNAGCPLILKKPGSWDKLTLLSDDDIMRVNMHRTVWMKSGFLFLLPLCLILTACHTPSAHYDPAKPPEPYMRVTRMTNGAVSLDIAVREFHSTKHRPTIYLVAASHLGQPEFYTQLQSRLDTSGLVLFEGVRAGEDRPDAAVRKMPKRDPGEYSLQADLAKSLGLQFQLDAIDYERPNFQNSDLTITQIAAILNPPPPPGARKGPPTAEQEDSGAAQFEELISAMDGSGFMGNVLQVALKFIGSSEKMRALVKLAFIETMGSLDGDMSNLEVPSPGLKELLQVLIQKRNHAVLTDLQAVLAEKHPPKSIAIFYGAAHMMDMETHLRDDLGYQPVATQWVQAFGVDPDKSGLSKADILMIKGIVDWQMKMLKPQAPKDKPAEPALAQPVK